MLYIQKGFRICLSNHTRRLTTQYSLSPVSVRLWVAVVLCMREARGFLCVHMCAWLINFSFLPPSFVPTQKKNKENFWKECRKKTVKYNMLTSNLLNNFYWQTQPRSAETWPQFVRTYNDVHCWICFWFATEAHSAGNGWKRTKNKVQVEKQMLPSTEK